ncbi:response regulator receiver protein [Chloroherpeton thalassium ATCC 35110]|uniref:Response regulator receiver protein n=1 Tax=Chloroherpeton thalassium (strain ATCC 35110 / GB-78) TaxID=517418 RepID=B3QV64_CHLT3|nr:response regulator [Chloroherpeton thalassium]ACF13018.1 response regulator receiver protein [Chloroherpeton thalassium ATCC 35110]
MNVLIVDDEPDILAALEYLLKDNKCSPVSVDDGEKAKSLLKSGKFDMVISDFIMPNLDGYELLSWLRKEGHNTFFVLMSGYYNNSFSDGFKKLQVDAILPKPFTRQSIQDIVSKCARRKPVEFINEEGINKPQAQPIAQQPLGEALSTEKSNKAVFLDKLVKDLPGIVMIAIMDSASNYAIRQTSTIKIFPKAFYGYIQSIIEQKKKVLNALHLTEQMPRDITVNTSELLHFIKPINNEGRIVYLAVSKQTANLSLVRLIIERYVEQMQNVAL